MRASESEGRAQDVVRFVEMLGRFPFEFLVLPGDDETASFAFELTIVQMFQQRWNKKAENSMNREE